MGLVELPELPVKKMVEAVCAAIVIPVAEATTESVPAFFTCMLYVPGVNGWKAL